MEGKFKIKIDEKITDEQFMEYCLNLKTSGYEPLILVGFYALGKGWNIDKLLFLQNLLEDIK